MSRRRKVPGGDPPSAERHLMTPASREKDAERLSPACVEEEEERWEVGKDVWDRTMMKSRENDGFN